MAGGGGGCVSETDAALCGRAGKNCGLMTANDNCGNPRQAQCGTCSGSQSCGGGGTLNVCWSPPVADGGVSIDLTGAIAIAYGNSGRLYGIDSAGNSRQAVYGFTPSCSYSDSACGVASGGFIFFSTYNQHYVGGPRGVYSLPRRVEGARPNGELVLQNAQLFSPQTGATRPLPVTGTVSSHSVNHALVVNSGLSTVVNLTTNLTFSVAAGRILELTPNRVLLDSAENSAALDTATGGRSASEYWTTRSISLSPDGALDPHFGYWFSATGIRTRATFSDSWAGAHGDWVIAYGASQLTKLHRRSTNTATTVLPTIVVDEAAVRNGVVLFVGLEQGLPALGKLDALTGVVTRWTPPERLHRVWFLEP